jgi:hypothetical protein
MPFQGDSADHGEQIWMERVHRPAFGHRTKALRGGVEKF